MSCNRDMDRQNLNELNGMRLGRISDEHIVQDSYGNRYIREEAVYIIINEINNMLFDLERGSSISTSVSFLNRSIIY